MQLLIYSLKHKYLLLHTQSLHIVWLRLWKINTHLNIPIKPVQPMPHGGYSPYNQPYNPAAVAYNNDQGEEEEEEEQDPYYRGYPPQYYQAPHGYHSGPSHSEDVELRSPGVARRFPRDIGRQESNVLEVKVESEDGGL